MSGIEILRIAAGVIAVADLGGKVSVKLFTFARKIKNADKSISGISRGTSPLLEPCFTNLANEVKRND